MVTYILDYMYFCEKKSEHVSLLNYPSFQHGSFFVTKTTAHSIDRNRPYSVYYQHAKFHHNPFTNEHNASLNVTTLFVCKLL